MVPNSTTPMTKPSPLLTLNTRLRNSRSGTTGSGVRRSASTNPPSSTAAATPSAMIVGDAQAYRVPPQLVTSSMQVTASASRAAPR
jgi:hypothetical protein